MSYNTYNTVVLINTIHVLSYDALNDTSIRDAVTAWLTNSTIVTELYGNIRTWNTSLVTDMYRLFDRNINYASVSSFNDDLSQWDVSRVTAMT